MLEVKNLSKKFRKISIEVDQSKSKNLLNYIGLRQYKRKIYHVGINNINFKAQKGKIFGLVGGNGAGKTTTMRIIAGITKPQGGSVTFEEKPINSIPNYKSKVAFVSGETQPYERLTPAEIMTLFAKLAKVPDEVIDEKMKEIAKKLQMESYLNTPINNFSSGMRQKVSIARALIIDPEIMIFDEITNGLDVFAHKAVIDMIFDAKNSGKIVIFSTHILSDADKVCDDIALIHDGEIILSGSKSQILLQYGAKDISDLFFKAVKVKSI